MGKIFFDMAMSLDGFIAGTNRSPQNPLGDNGPQIHNWMFKQKAFWEHHGRNGGEEDGEDGKLIHDVFSRSGSYIMGKRMFEEGEPNWPEDLFKASVFVLTHEKREPWVQKGTTTFYFINDGFESALEKAKQAANGKDIRLSGGANTVQQFLNSGHIDEFTLHISPILIGSGVRLFDNVDKNKFDIKIKGTQHSYVTTHVTYEVIKK
ncbi:MAG: dihydrofolate reductase family protein [Bacteroidetes bacterium]|nr:dihydrofolate reductase family protein [Bacteroidota bacterium]